MDIQVLEYLDRFLVHDLSRIVGAYTPFAGITCAILQVGEEILSLVALPAANSPTQLVVGCGDNTVQIWGLTGSPRILRGHLDTVTTLTVLHMHDTVVLASASDDDTIRIWDVSSELNTATQVLRGHTNRINALAGLPDGRLVSGSADETIAIWDLTTEDSRILEGHIDVTALAVLPHPNNTRIVSGFADGTIHIWGLPGGNGNNQVLIGHTDWINALVVLPDGRLASGSNDTTIRIWDLATGTSQVLTGHTDWVTTLTVLNDGRLVSGSVDRTIRLWDLSSDASSPTQVLAGHTKWITALAVLSDGSLASGSEDGTVRIWE